MEHFKYFIVGGGMTADAAVTGIRSIDDLYATISRANFDNRSFRLNFEITMAFADSDFALDVRRMLEEDFKKSEAVKAAELKGKGFWFRFAVRCARLMAPVQ